MPAFRRAFDITMATVSADDWELERTRQRLVFSLPELKVVQFEMYRRVVSELAEADSRRTGHDADDFELRIFFGALAGALTAVIDRAPGSIELMYRALDFHRGRYAVGDSWQRLLKAADRAQIESPKTGVTAPLTHRAVRHRRIATIPEVGRGLPDCRYLVSHLGV